MALFRGFRASAHVAYRVGARGCPSAICADARTCSRCEPLGTRAGQQSTPSDRSAVVATLPRTRFRGTCTPRARPSWSARSLAQDGVLLLKAWRCNDRHCRPQQFTEKCRSRRSRRNNPFRVTTRCSASSRASRQHCSPWVGRGESLPRCPTTWFRAGRRTPRMRYGKQPHRARSGSSTRQRSGGLAVADSQH